MPYLITGATGPVGRSIVAQLRSKGQDVRIITRDVHKAPANVEALEGDFTQGDLPASAFEGVNRVFLFPAQGGVDAFLKQAKAAQVEQIVVLSSLAAAMEYERDKTSWSALHHLAIEKAVIASGIPYTFLRPGSFANNLLFWVHSIQTGGAVYEPYPNSVQAPIHEADIAAVAVAALTQDGHQGKTYSLTGPQALTRLEQLNCIGTAIGKKLHFQEIPVEAFQTEMEKYMPRPVIKMLLDYWSDTVTAPDVVLPTVEQVTFQKARTLAQWATDHASDFSHQVLNEHVASK
ncbi:NAD(P)H-binding protein [Tengunoibacter tsumagoiensis]|uniref:Nucleotide-diphosphate-sugar epimerase n=1 Tax=Tengunoibacter tsumagoiensis TaxID=2014871 RepID=A0A402A8I3_9CHLR|nr:NAD(P)H-binding protein [Tengunoibacter tsumagoiensis]GCE15474.1 nucleotide-diphosphate-sugar epimerase [Tengunoibacter tsumagoiensis]